MLGQGASIFGLKASLPVKNWVAAEVAGWSRWACVLRDACV